MSEAVPLMGDFHMHTWHSKDCGTPPRSLMERAIKVGLSCIAVTDHNTTAGGREIKAMAPPELKVIVAEEIKTPHGEITGFFLQEDIPAGLSPEETCKRIKDQGGLVSIPHPYDRVRRSVLDKEVLEAIKPYIDIVEVFNSRTPMISDSNKALEFAKEHDFLAGAGSDAHCARELGHVFIEMEQFDDIEGFKNSLRHAKIHGRRSTPLYHVVTTLTKWRKKYLPFSMRH
jgi:predicted metal-dependent phosphoesterase TrpH